jgi:hypothetical protein
MIRILAIAATVAALWPTVAISADVGASPMARLAALTQSPEKRMTPRPGVRVACWDSYVRCDGPSACRSQCCGTYRCDSNGYCECY